jgi:dephospho-CoA kinase
MNTLPKLLILGHARHGKDTFGEIIRDIYGYKFNSSSQAAADIFIYDELKEKYGYKTSEECFEDRVNHRPEWHQMIKDYNKYDQAKLAKSILETNDCYIGMRDTDEILECKRQGLFDLIIWVDASDRKPQEGKDSMNIDKSIADFIVENNGTLEEFEERVCKIADVMLKVKEVLI